LEFPADAGESAATTTAKVKIAFRTATPVVSVQVLLVQGIERRVKVGSRSFADCGH
jgi:hypothetical protein